MRWPIALAVGFAVLFVMNFTYVYLALTHPDPVVSSYHTEPR